MYRPITMYELVCDRCGKVFEGTDVASAILCKPHLEEMSGFGGFEQVEGKHYCPECYDVSVINDEYIVIPKKGSMKKSDETITDFECGQWSVIQNVIGFVKDYSLAAELCREASIGYKKIKALQKDCGYSYKEEVNDFLKESRNGGTNLMLEE